MNIDILLSELDKLNIPIDKFAITSSGSMGIRNIREIGDLDIIVYPEIWQDLSKKYKIVIENNINFIYIGNIQVIGDKSIYANQKFGDIINQIDNADLINGHRYVQLKTVLEIKKQKNQPKDINDVKLIEEYFVAMHGFTLRV